MASTGSMSNFNPMGLPMTYPTTPSSYMFQGFPDSTPFSSQGQGKIITSCISKYFHIIETYV